MLFSVSFIEEGILTKVTFMGPILFVHLLHMGGQTVSMVRLEPTCIADINFTLFMHRLDVSVAQVSVLEQFPANGTFVLVEAIVLVRVHLQAPGIIKGFRASRTRKLLLLGMIPVVMTLHGIFGVKQFPTVRAWALGLKLFLLLQVLVLNSEMLS